MKCQRVCRAREESDEVSSNQVQGDATSSILSAFHLHHVSHTSPRAGAGALDYRQSQSAANDRDDDRRGDCYRRSGFFFPRVYFFHSIICPVPASRITLLPSTNSSRLPCAPTMAGMPSSTAA